MDELLELLEDLLPNIDFENEDKLIDDSVLDSFDIITIVNKLNDEYDIEITAADLLPENFNSAENIWRLVCEKQENE